MADPVRPADTVRVPQAQLDEFEPRLEKAEELLRRHVIDWGKCDHPDDCSCSDAEARRFLGWELS